MPNAAAKRECPVCHQKFDVRGLSGHIRFTHSGIARAAAGIKLKTKRKPIVARRWPVKKAKPCPACPKTYKNLSHLIAHMEEAHGVVDYDPSSAVQQRRFPMTPAPEETNSTPGKSHLQLQIEETEAKVVDLEAQAARLRDVLDILIGAQHDIGSRSL